MRGTGLNVRFLIRVLEFKISTTANLGITVFSRLHLRTSRHPAMFSTGKPMSFIKKYFHNLHF